MQDIIGEYNKDIKFWKKSNWNSGN
jgi:hypothetical protein